MRWHTHLFCSAHTILFNFRISNACQVFITSRAKTKSNLIPFSIVNKLFKSKASHYAMVIPTGKDDLSRSTLRTFWLQGRASSIRMHRLLRLCNCTRHSQKSVDKSLRLEECIRKHSDIRYCHCNCGALACSPSQLIRMWLFSEVEVSTSL